MIYLRGLVMNAVVYGLLLCMGLVALPTAVVSRRGALWWCKTYVAWIFAILRPVCGIRTEVRGTPPAHPCIVASNHQSFLDVLLLVQALPEPRFVMKRSLLWVPVLGYFARRIGCVAIDRGSPGAIGTILDGMAGQVRGGQMIIYPQGTRMPPGKRVPFRAGVVAMHRGTGLPVELAATNAGHFWPGRGVWRRPGLAVIAFLGPEAGTDLGAMQARIEAAADELAPGG